jgi:hypothetical protein
MFSKHTFFVFTIILSDCICIIGYQFIFLTGPKAIFLRFAML